jgi:hypothetical protein
MMYVHMTAQRQYNPCRHREIGCWPQGLLIVCRHKKNVRAPDGELKRYTAASLKEGFHYVDTAILVLSICIPGLALAKGVHLVMGACQ